MIIVTGATGFIGFYLVNQLFDDGFNVLAVDKGGTEEASYFIKKDIPFIQMDITKQSEFSKLPQEGIEAIVNLACMQPANMREENYDPREYIYVNVLGVINILEFCLKNNINRIVHTISHRNVQKLWELGEIIGEDSVRAIKFSGKYSMFSISESAAEDIIRHYIQEYGIKGILLRLPPVLGYGHHEYMYKDGKVCKTGLKVFIDNAISGKPIEVWGNSEEGRDIIYVKDVVLAIVRSLKNNNAVGLYNIASGKKLSLKEEVETIIKVFSSDKNPSKIIYRKDQPNSIEPFVYDISKAKKDLGWAPKYSFEQMMLDYKKEMENGRLKFLLDRKERMLFEG
jgi:UDP-glucose 4-epimerase